MGLKHVTGAAVIRWISKHCIVPEGPLIGQPVTLLPFQKKIIYAIVDGHLRRVIISCGKKNGKTTFTACLLLAKLAGPQKLENAQLYSTAQSREQAAVLFDLAAKMVRMSPTLSQYVDIHETRKMLTVPELGSRYRALSADADTAHGISPSFVVHDELGQVRGPRWELYQTIERSFGAQQDGLSVIISTQAASDGDLLSILIDDAQRGADPDTRLFLHSADPALDPFEESTWRFANPAYGVFLNPKEVRGQAETARRIPSEEATFRNYVLNQRIQAESPFISRGVWEDNAGTPAPLADAAAVFGGLDLASTSDLTCLVLVTDTGDVHPIFWLPRAGLEEKARRDRVAWDVWAREGYLQTTPGASVEYEYVATRLREVFATCKIQALAFDRYNMKHLRPWLLKAGFTEQEIAAKFVDFGQGLVSMAPAIRELESRLLAKKLRHGNHPVLTMCLANARIVSDAAGNRKFDKQRATGRIDGAVALAMAVGVMPLITEKPAPKFQMMFV